MCVLGVHVLSISCVRPFVSIKPVKNLHATTDNQADISVLVSRYRIKVKQKETGVRQMARSVEIIGQARTLEDTFALDSNWNTRAAIFVFFL